MIHKIPKLDSVCDDYLWWDNLFTDAELQVLRDIAIKSELEAKVGNYYKGNELVSTKDDTYRRTKLAWMKPSPDNEWIYEKLSYVIQSLNRDYYRFDIDGFTEQLQFCNYDSADQGHYDWHVDRGSNSCVRKLSLVLQLTDPEKYTGGELQIKNAVNDIHITKKAGLITVFPSWTLHRVTPVLTGSRQSLVAWVSGNPFR